jgi:hypothetical protein
MAATMTAGVWLTTRPAESNTATAIQYWARSLGMVELHLHSKI